jgi:hypothetical protein
MRSLLLSAALVLSACATTKAATVEAPPPAKPTTPAAPPADDAATQRAKLEALFVRESEAAPAQSFTLKGQPLSVESSTPVEVVRDDAAKSTTLTLGVGASTKVTCYLFDEPVDVGALVSRTLTNLKKELQLTQVRPSGIEVIEKNPAIFLEVGYTADTKAGRSLGQLKLMVYAAEEAPLLCLFDEPGYVKSFHRVASALAGAAGKALATATPAVYRSIDVTRIGELDVGFSRTEWLKEKDGTYALTSTNTMLVPRSPTEWMTSDSATATKLEKDLTVKEKTFISASNGEMERQMVLKHGKGGAYTYEGVLQGKDLKGSLKTRDGKGLASDLTVAKLTREQLLGGKKTELQLEDYAPDADPTAFTLVTLKRTAAPRGVSVELGPMKLDTEVDASGLPEKVSLAVGPMTLRERRVFVEGAAP